jgi:hypothetical protein
MPSYFPRHTASWKIEEPAAVRRLSMSLVEIAAITGVVVRLYRAVAITHGSPSSWVYVAITITLGSAFILGMATLHLGNFTLRRWVWRAPAFAAIEATAESVTSLVLITLHREPMGSGRAEFHDWVGMSVKVFIWRMIWVLVYAAFLAGVVQLVRRFLATREHRMHTARAVHSEAARQRADTKGTE